MSVVAAALATPNAMLLHLVVAIVFPRDLARAADGEPAGVRRRRARPRGAAAGGCIWTDTPSRSPRCTGAVAPPASSGALAPTTRASLGPLGQRIRMGDNARGPAPGRWSASSGVVEDVLADAPITETANAPACAASAASKVAVLTAGVPRAVSTQPCAEASPAGAAVAVSRGDDPHDPSATSTATCPSRLTQSAAPGRQMTATDIARRAASKRFAMGPPRRRIEGRRVRATRCRVNKRSESLVELWVVPEDPP